MNAHITIALYQIASVISIMERTDIMASKTPRKDKDGNITSYQIEVYRGRDSEGKKLKPFSMTWKVPDNWKSPSKIQKELDRVAALFEEECKKGNVSIVDITFKKYSDYLMTIYERDKKHRTVHRYKQLLERINEEIGHIKLSKITAKQLNDFYVSLGQDGANKNTGKGLSPKTINHYHSLIHSILDQAVLEDIISRNVADKAKPPKLVHHEAEFLEIEDIYKLRDVLAQEPLKWQALTNLFIFTGARRGEILGLYWADIDFKNNRININKNLQYTPERGIYLESSTKNGEDRSVSVAPEIIRMLHDYKKEQLQRKLELGTYWQETGFVFTQENGTPMYQNSFNKFLDRLSEKHNLPKIHPHMFRHTQASLLYASGVDPVTISKRLGHKRVSTTQDIYSHLLKGNDERASNNIASILKKPQDKSNAK